MASPKKDPIEKLVQRVKELEKKNKKYEKELQLLRETRRDLGWVKGILKREKSHRELKKGIEEDIKKVVQKHGKDCLLYTSPSPRD